LANLCSCIRFKALEVYIDPSAGTYFTLMVTIYIPIKHANVFNIFFSSVGVLNKSSISLLVEIALRLAKDGEKVRLH